MRSLYQKLYEGMESFEALFYQGHYNPVFIVRDSDTAYLSSAFQRLTEGAKLNRPLMPDDKGVLCGSLIDKYGICWNFYSAME